MLFIQNYQMKDLNFNFQMELDILGNGVEWIDMDMEYKFGKMEQNMKVSGEIIKLTGKDYLHMSMEINMKVIGKMIEFMVMEKILLSMVQYMKVNLNLMCSMVKV